MRPPPHACLSTTHRNTYAALRRCDCPAGATRVAMVCAHTCPPRGRWTTQRPQPLRPCVVIHLRANSVRKLQACRKDTIMPVFPGWSRTMPVLCWLLAFLLNARILRLPRPVVKDYACPFVCHACPFVSLCVRPTSADPPDYRPRLRPRSSSLPITDLAAVIRTIWFGSNHLSDVQLPHLHWLEVSS